jgi:hypothetical protein
LLNLLGAIGLSLIRCILEQGLAHLLSNITLYATISDWIWNLVKGDATA